MTLLRLMKILNRLLRRAEPYKLELEVLASMLSALDVSEEDLSRAISVALNEWDL